VTTADEVISRIKAGETDLIQLIPTDRYVLRRVVAARAGVGMPWAQLANAMGADKMAVHRWYHQGVEIIVSAINASL
jgi:hypothetical protein